MILIAENKGWKLMTDADRIQLGKTNSE